MNLRIRLVALVLACSSGIAADKPASASDSKSAKASAETGQPSLYTRMILVQKPENLKKVKDLDAKKPTSQLLVDYLKQNKVTLDSPAYARFDAKTQAVTIHATLVDLDRAETALSKLTQMK